MEHVHGTYDTLLVFFSYIIAVVASYTALDLAGRVSKTRGKSRLLWLIFGAVVMGMGIWSLHFVGMLAFSLPIPIAYDLLIVLLSVVVAMLAAFVALYVVNRQKLTLPRLLSGGVLLAVGISSMHYIGMEAMLVELSYEPFLFYLSIIIAFVASFVALWLFRKSLVHDDVWKKLVSGMVMGAAIAGMHYTGMEAAQFQLEDKAPLSVGMILEQKLLAYVISGGTLLTLGLSLFSVFISKRLAHKDTEMLENKSWYESLYKNNQDGIISVNLQGRITGFNQAIAKITGRPLTELQNKHFDYLLSYVIEEDKERIRKKFLKSNEGEAQSTETTIKRQNGKLVEIKIIIVPVVVDSQVVGNHIIVKDITEEKKAQKKIHDLAFHDDLTGLPNRRMFHQSVALAIEQKHGQAERFTVMVIDIDRFKLINDSLGHTYGDRFLQEVSKRIEESVAGYKVLLARIGGDEFTLLFDGCHNEEEITAAAERIIQAIQQPYRLKDNDFYVTASIGAAIFPDHGQDSLQLLKNADTAMYEVKKLGKNGFRFFTPDMNIQVLSKVELEMDLHKAIERGELLLYYQPQFRVNNQTLVGVEALIRWQHPTKGMLPPGLFMPIAEESGLIYEVGSWVLREACQQMRQWHDAGGPRIPVAVNLSSQQFHQPNIVANIRQILEETGLEPRYLEIEITESVMMDVSVSKKILQELKELGVQISLDDFGTGFSSLSYLKQFPIEKLKIDRSFIQDITTNENDKAIVATIISMAQHLQMEVIAEGIETKEQLDILLQNKCKEIQGYYFSRPLPATDVETEFFVPHRGKEIQL